MRSNYKKLGQFIREVSVKNKDLSVELLLGVSITKQFIPSIANTVGTDMSNYKVVEHHQFAYGPVTSRNGEKISVALLGEEKCIVSTSYTVFEIVDTELLDPEYLMMWFRRSEFDRYARYMSHGTVRELFGWQEMCDVELPVPSIEKQREIVREYNVVNDRIALNEQLTKKLEETAQAIYKQWFVDFEFPISKEYAESIGNPELEGKPYKSAGGEMRYCEALEQDIPINWRNGCFGDLANQFSGYSFKGEQYNFVEGTTVIRGENVTEGKLRFDTHKRWNLALPNKAKSCFLMEKDIVIGMDGSKVGKNWALISSYQLPLLLAQRVCCVRAKTKEHQLWLYISIKVRKFAEYVSQVHTGTSVPHISGDQIMAFGV
ncbi:restriction endonuclease subunit S, partial [Vibrio cholerae]